MEEMGFLSGNRIVCMDGIHFNPKDNLTKYGRSEKGCEAIVLQIYIEHRCFAVHAAMSEDGFIAWEIFEGNVLNTDVANFIRERLAPKFGADKYLLLDNAANQKTDHVLDTMERCLKGRYKFNAEYSPELNPIERGFSLVRHWIREHEHEYEGKLIELINHAFFTHSVEGHLGDKCYNFFDLYRYNHKCFLDEIASTAYTD